MGLNFVVFRASWIFLAPAKTSPMEANTSLALSGGVGGSTASTMIPHTTAGHPIISYFLSCFYSLSGSKLKRKKNNYQWSHYGWIRPLGMCKKGFPQFPSQKCCQNHNFHKSSVGNPIPEPMPWAIWAPRIGPSHAIPNFKLFLGFTTWLCPKIRKIPPNSADSFEKTGSQPPDFGVFHGFPWFHHQICWVLL